MNIKIARMSTLFLCILILVLIVPSVAAASPNPDYAAIDSYVESQCRASNIPGLAIGIVRGDQVVHLSGFGKGGSAGGAITPQTPFILGSVSKGFTALSVIQLAEAGKIDLNATVQTYLPWFTLADAAQAANITIRDLLYQTSGLGYYDSLRPFWDNPGKYTLEERIHQLADVKPHREPGIAFEYSNYNYMILGLIVEKVSGQPYGEYIRQNIFMPLQMNNSFTSPEQVQDQEMAVGHRWWFGIPFAVEAPYLYDALPAGCIISSAEDMTHYLVAQLNQGTYGNNPPVISTEGLIALHTPPSDVDSIYCMGWVRGPVGTVNSLYHEGEAEGYYSIVIIEPESGWGIVVLSNVSDMFVNPVKDIAVRILEYLKNGSSLKANQSFWIKYGIFDFVVVALTGLIIWFTFRIPRWSRKLVSKPPHGIRAWLWRVILPILGEFIFPYVVLAFLPQGAGFPMWKVMGIFQPDVVFWIMFLVGLFVFRGLLRIGLACFALRKKNA